MAWFWFELILLPSLAQVAMFAVNCMVGNFDLYRIIISAVNRLKNVIALITVTSARYET